MKLAQAEPVYNWDNLSCEGIVPSSHTCVSTGEASCPTHPGLGAACWRSNVAERNLLSYGGQQIRWLEQRRHYNEQETASSSAAAPKKALKKALDLHDHRFCGKGSKLSFLILGMIGDLQIAPQVSL